MTGQGKARPLEFGLPHLRVGKRRRAMGVEIRSEISVRLSKARNLVVTDWSQHVVRRCQLKRPLVTMLSCQVAQS
jgi:hypothetical protein